ncbi:MAG: O-antigen ligase family protein [Parcubacteria group bacterium]
MNKNVYQWILKIGLISSFLIVFALFEKLFYPYVVSKQLTFNILIEVLMVFWLVYIVKYKEERPKLKLLSWSLIAFFTTILVSVLVSIDPHLSFWGKTERMLGFVNVAHFLFYYLIIITAFKRLKDYKYLLSALILAATGVALAMLSSGNSKAVIGNQAYTAGFFIFALFFSAYLFFKTKDNWKYLFLLPVLIILPAFVMADITGAVIGLGAGLFVALVLVALSYKRLWYRLGAAILAILIVVTISVSFAYPDNEYIENNKVLTQISVENNTFQTRLIGWNAALEGYKEYPVLGTGYNTFSYTFDKHFDAEFYNHSKTETYFDRAHNNLLDIASTMGTVGLLAYLMIMISAALYLFKVYILSRRKEKEASDLDVDDDNDIADVALKMNSKKLKKLKKKMKKKLGYDDNKDSANNLSYLHFSHSNELLALISLFALLVAYFVQNLAVFDTFITYLALMIFLAFIRFIYFDIKGYYNKDSEEKHKSISKTFEYILFIILIIIFGALMYKLNISTFKAHSQAIEGYAQTYRGEANEGLDTFVRALDSQTELQRDPRTSLIKLVLNSPHVTNNLSDEEKIEYYNRLLVLNSYNLKTSNNYSVYLTQESQIFNKMGDLYKKLENEEKSRQYKEKALEYINMAIEASPERIKHYWLKGQTLIDLGQDDAGLEQWQKTIDLNENYGETYCQYAQAYLILGEEDKVWPQMDKCISSGGLNSYSQNAVLMRAVKHYQAEGDYEKMIVAYHRYAELVDSADVWQSLAELYTEMDNWQEAKVSALRALELVTDEKKRSSIKVFLDIVEKKLSK